jgi:sterol desaturase/sphingolipid hydroxylase (fatty acid hydroxylase superfamily)
MAANLALVGWALASGAALASVTLLGLVTTIASFVALEKLSPYRGSWQTNGGETLRDLFYFAMNGGIDALTKLVVAFGVASFGSHDNGLPIWASLPLAILTIDFLGYWLHRWGHSGWLWKVHGVHHTPDKVNTLNNNTIHFINTAYGAFSKTVPLMLLGFAPDVIIVAAYLSTLWSFAVHANVDVDLGKLDLFFMSPVHHRLHHSTRIEEAGNFATVTTLWDRIFGTFVYAPGLAPEEIGVVDPTTFPEATAVLDNQLHPFVDRATRASAHRG